MYSPDFTFLLLFYFSNFVSIYYIMNVKSNFYHSLMHINCYIAVQFSTTLNFHKYRIYDILYVLIFNI